MRILLEAALSNAVVASLLALVVAAICRLPIRPAARHALWLIVLVKFVTPPFFRLEIPNSLCLNPWRSGHTIVASDVAARESGENREVSAGQSHPQERPSPTVSSVAVDPGELSIGPPDTLMMDEDAQGSLAEPIAESIMVAASSTVSAAPAVGAAKDASEGSVSSLATFSAKSVEPTNSAVNLSAILGTVWIGGSVAWFLFAGFRLRAFHRQVVRLLPADRELQALANEAAIQLGLKKPPLLRITEAVVPPMLTLVPNRAVIILPARLMSTLSRSQQSAILAHELAHFRRGDQWMRWFEFLVVGLYWWHPVVWYARRQLQAAEELCCDAWVLRVFPDQARGYAHALLAAVDFLAEVRAPAPAEACTLGPISTLKQRLDMILKRKPFPELTPAAKLAVAALALVILPWAPELFGQAPATSLPADPAPAVAPTALPPGAQNLPETAPPAKTPPNVPVPPRAVAPGQVPLPPDPAPRPPTAGNAVTPPPVAPLTAAPPRPAPAPSSSVTWPVAASYGPPGQPGATPGAGPQGKSIEERLDRLERMIEQLVTRAPAQNRYTAVEAPVATPVGVPSSPNVVSARKRSLWTEGSLAATDKRIRELEQELEILKRRKEAFSKVDPNGLAIGVVPQEKAIKAFDTATGAILWSFSIDNPESVQSATSDGQFVTVTTKDGNTYRLDSKTGRLILGALPASPASVGPLPKYPPTPSSQGLQQN